MEDHSQTFPWSPLVVDVDGNVVSSEDEDRDQFQDENDIFNSSENVTSDKAECLKFFLQAVEKYPVIYDLGHRGKKINGKF